MSFAFQVSGVVYPIPTFHKTLNLVQPATSVLANATISVPGYTPSRGQLSLTLCLNATSGLSPNATVGTFQVYRLDAGGTPRLQSPTLTLLAANEYRYIIQNPMNSGYFILFTNGSTALTDFQVEAFAGAQ